MIPVYRISAPTSMPHAAGVGEKYLTKYFRDFPEHDHSQLKIRHVLHLYFQNERSVAKTMHAFAQRLNLRCSPRQIRRVTVDVLKRFKHLSRQNEMTSFAEICNESFTSYTVILDESDFTAGNRSGENEVLHQDLQETVPGPIVQTSPITLSIPPEPRPAQTILGSSLITEMFQS